MQWNSVPGDWEIILRDDGPQSSVGPLLGDFLWNYLCLWEGLSPEDLRDAFSGVGEHAQRHRDLAIAAIRILRTPLQDGSFATYSRALGGGEPVRMPTSHWEVDDLLPRFARSAYAAAAPYDRDAEPSHWIFVAQSAEVAIHQIFVPTTPYPAEAASTPHPDPVVADPGHRVGAVGDLDDGFLRLPEVVRLTGLGKSTLYERVAEGRFPASEPIGGGRAVGWRRSAVREWLANPR